MTRVSRSPIEGVDRVLVDGSNLLHAIRRGPTPLPAAALVGRLRGAIPPSVGIELVFDGPPEPGLRGERIASGVVVRHSGRRTADQLIVSLVEEARAATGPEGADNMLVITDDRELREAVQSHGARTARSPWLVARLSRERLEAPAVGNRRAATAPAPPADEERAGWRPGRGATRKRGNPRRARKPPAGRE